MTHAERAREIVEGAFAPFVWDAQPAGQTILSVLVKRVEASLLAVERETVGRCARVAEEAFADPAWHQFMLLAANYIAAAIRRLAPAAPLDGREGEDAVV